MLYERRFGKFINLNQKFSYHCSINDVRVQLLIVGIHGIKVIRDGQYQPQKCLTISPNLSEVINWKRD